jgi:hypothetical protein
MARAFVKQGANNKISKKGTFGTTMGVTSIIAILVILVLIVFSALSITTSKADLTLSEKTAAATTAYYAADSKATMYMSELIHAIENGRDPAQVSVTDGVENDNIKMSGSGYEASYEVKIDEGKSLFVDIVLDADGDITSKQWQVQSTADWEPDQNLNLIIE